MFFCLFLQTTSENERTRCTEILEPCSLCPYPLPRPFIRSLSVFIITLVFFPSLRVHLIMKSRIEEGSTSPEPLAGVCPSWNEGRTQQLAFQFVFDPIHDVALPTDAVNCYRVLALSLLSVFRIKFRPFPIFHWENEVLPQRKEDCAYSSCTTREKEKKKTKMVFINLN